MTQAEAEQLVRDAAERCPVHKRDDETWAQFSARWFDWVERDLGLKGDAAAREKAEEIITRQCAHLLRGRGIGAFDARDLIVIVAKGLDAYAAEQTAALLALVEQTANALRPVYDYAEGLSLEQVRSVWACYEQCRSVLTASKVQP